MNHRFHQKKKSGAAAGDDRNLILVDEDFQDADFEDRVWLFWQRHGKKTIAAAVAVFLAIIGVIVYIEVGKMRLAALQAEYSAAQTISQKLAFAQMNESDPLAGTAYFSAGGELANEGKFAEAAESFSHAARIFSGKKGFSAMRDRAVISQAASLARTGTPEAQNAADVLLKKLAETPDADPLYRGQAMYELASNALARGNTEDARIWINEMDRSLDPLNFWQIRKRGLIAIEPKLLLQNAEAPAAEIQSPEQNS